MVNKTVLDYLKKHKNEYKIRDLQKRIISAGYSKKDVDEALGVLNLKKSAKPVEKGVKPTKIIKQPKPLVESTKLVKPVEKVVKPINIVKQVKPMKKAVKPLAKSAEQPKGEPVKPNKTEVNQESLVRPDTSPRYLKVAGISGILIIVFSVLSFIFGGVGPAGDSVQLTIASFVFPLLVSMFSILFFYGFVILGKKYDQKLIRVVGLILMIFTILIIVFQIFLIISPSLVVNEILVNKIVSQVQAGFDFSNLIETLLLYLFIILLIGLVYIILGVLFGVGLLRLKEVKYSKLSGILHIIGSCTLIVGIGAVILFVAFIFEIILLFKASKMG